MNSDSSAYPWFAPVDRSRGERGKRWLLIKCLSLVVLLVIGVVWIGVQIASTPEGGVKVASNMDQYAVEYLAQHEFLEPGERVVAYYDATLSMDGTEAAILTTLAVKYHQGGTTMSIPISKIADDVERQGWRLFWREWRERADSARSI